MSAISAEQVAEFLKLFGFEERTLDDLRGTTDSVQRIVEDLVALKVPADQQKAVPPASSTLQRQQHLVWLYTDDYLYGEMNQGLRADDEAIMQDYAGYIHELRDCFRIGHKFGILTPYEGACRRGMTVANIDELIDGLELEKDFMFPTFTSTTTGNILVAFRWDVQLEFITSMLPTQDGQYGPGGVSQFSKYPREDEVLWPPHVRIRLHNLRHPSRGDNEWCIDSEYGCLYIYEQLLNHYRHKSTYQVHEIDEYWCEVCTTEPPVLELENIEFPSIWHIIEEGQLEILKQWT